MKPKIKQFKTEKEARSEAVKFGKIYHINKIDDFYAISFDYTVYLMENGEIECVNPVLKRCYGNAKFEME